MGAVTLIKSGNQALIDRVIKGRVPLLEAAAEVRQIVELNAAFRSAQNKIQKEFVGSNLLRIWDQIEAITA